jgi:SNF2 family DNA or RNA helicase
VTTAGHRALVFSRFTGFLAHVRAALDAAGIAYAHLDGTTRDREAAIAGFKDGDAPVFLVNLKAGGFGLNLTEADYCSCSTRGGTRPRRRRRSTGRTASGRTAR